MPGIDLQYGLMLGMVAATLKVAMAECTLTDTCSALLTTRFN